MSLEDQQLDFINYLSESLQYKYHDLVKKGHLAIAEGVKISIVEINIIAITQWNLPTEKLYILED